MKKRVLGGMLTVCMVFGMAGGASAEEKDVTITLLNTKPEIQTQIETMAEEYKELTGVTIEAYSSTSGSEEVSKRYAAGDPPTMMMLDMADALTIGPEKGLDLSGENWVEAAGNKAAIVGDAVYGFPVCMEGRGMIYNKKAIEDTLGEEFKPEDITDLDDFEDLLKRLADAGMETPVAVNQDNWALAGHFFGNLIELQDGTTAGGQKFIDAVVDGSQNVIDNERFNSYMDVFDVMKEYNINRDDPLAADYAQNTMYLAEGDTAFTINGNWLWPDIQQYTDSEEFGMMSVPQNPAEDEMNQYIHCLYSKQIIIDKESASEEEVQAAKDFLNWLASDEAGIEFVVSDCKMVSPFSSDTEMVTDPLGKCVLEYVNDNKAVEPYLGLKSDFIVVVGASFQKYLGDEINRTELATEIQEYLQTSLG